MADEPKVFVNALYAGVIHTTVEDELQLDELHVDQLRVDRLVGNAHPDVFHLDEVALERVVEPVLELDKVGELPGHSESLRWRCSTKHTHLGVFLSAESADDELCGLVAKA